MSATTATDFFAYFFHPRKKVGPRWPSDSLFEARRAELRGARPEARILAIATTAAKFFAYFLTPKSRASLAKRHSLPLPCGRSFLSTPQKGTKKVTTEGTGLPWLALRRREANSHTLGVLKQCLP